MPSFETHSTETPTPINPLGAKGIGEGGDDRIDTGDPERGHRRRLAPRVRHIDMPCTPGRVWAAIQSGATVTPTHGAPAADLRHAAQGHQADEEDAAAADSI